MKRVYYLLFLCIVFATYSCQNAKLATTATGEKQSLDIYLLIGQSNMAGRAEITTEYRDTLNNVYLLNENNRFEKAANPLNKYSTIRKELNMQKLGPGYSFSKKIAAVTKRRIGLVVNARGGSSIKSWEKGNADGYYEAALIRAKEAMKYGKIKAILWHQGEANVSTPANYKVQITNLVNNLRQDLNNPKLFFIAGEISQWNWTKSPEGTKPFNDMIKSIDTFIPYSACISSDSLTPFVKDGSDPHFDTDSQIKLGERYADAVLRHVYRISTTK